MIRLWICPKKRKIRFWIRKSGFGFSRKNAPLVIKVFRYTTSSPGRFSPPPKPGKSVLGTRLIRYSFLETIPMFFNHVKSDFILVRSPQNFHQWLTMNWSVSKSSSIWLWQQQTKNFEIDKIRILLDLDLLLKIRHQELKVWCLANNLREK